MIDYSPFWNTLKQSTESTYTLINHYHISSSTIDKLRKNKPVNTTTLNDLCRVCCKIKIPKVAKQNWRKLHLQIGESCKHSPEALRNGERLSGSLQV